MHTSSHHPNACLLTPACLAARRPPESQAASAREGRVGRAGRRVLGRGLPCLRDDGLRRLARRPEHEAGDGADARSGGQEHRGAGAREARGGAGDGDVGLGRRGILDAHELGGQVTSRGVAVPHARRRRHALPVEAAIAAGAHALAEADVIAEDLLPLAGGAARLGAGEDRASSHDNVAVRADRLLAPCGAERRCRGEQREHERSARGGHGGG
mmetsp:Transcript_41045/g.122648  ORF Transcript_41045/g.122648 Transcript_41045/m.122648 type:complete len:213 (-) Transcript_41045:63-701(-)